MQEREGFLRLGDLLDFVIAKEESFVDKREDEFFKDFDSSVVFAAGNELFEGTTNRK